MVKIVGVKKKDVVYGFVPLEKISCSLTFSRVTVALAPAAAFMGSRVIPRPEAKAGTLYADA